MPTAEWKKICCPIDFSDASRAAMEIAADVARRNDGELTLLHAYPIPGYTFPDGSVVASPSMLQELADQAQRHLDEWAAEAARLGARVVTAKAVGEPAHEILAFAQAQGTQLVVLGTHGRTGLEHALMGSIAERVVRRARCPVLTVHPSTPRPGKRGKS
ncbi:MAG TPA: universal stress protein [Anaeromyxobacter sp.]|nr:universal stress protein [Anaeromyxobacter sp.]